MTSVPPSASPKKRPRAWEMARGTFLAWLEAAMDYLDLVDELGRLVQSSSRMPLTGLALVKESDVVALLARLRAAVPAEADELHRLRQERAHILARARADADDVVLRAHEEVERLVHDPHLQRDARQRADEVLHEAEEKAELIRAGADAFVATTLETLDQRLSDLETILAHGLLALHQGTQVLGARVAADLDRGEPTPQVDSTTMRRESARQEYRGATDESAPNHQPASGPDSPAADSPLA